jgi:hypothetical protein
MDADPEFTMTFPSHNTMVVETKTTPSLAQLVMIGEGSKGLGGDTIGQFGEGFKMAALTATRHTQGELVAWTPTKRISFGLENVEALGAESLFAHVQEINSDSPGFRVIVTYPGAQLASAGKFLPDRTNGPVDGSSFGENQFFCKGVWISGLGKCLRSWNLNDVEINRDRNQANQWQLVINIAYWVNENGSLDREFLTTEPCFETENRVGVYVNESARRRLREKWFEIHGENAVLISTDTDANARAKKAGKKIIVAANKFVKEIGVPDASMVDYKVEERLEMVDIEPYREQVRRIRRIDDAIIAHPATVVVFKGDGIAQMGLADFDENRIWLADELFQPGRELDLMRTYLHEQAHFKSKAGDRTYEFENMLDYVAGVLALKLLEVS